MRAVLFAYVPRLEQKRSVETLRFDPSVLEEGFDFFVAHNSPRFIAAVPIDGLNIKTGRKFIEYRLRRSAAKVQLSFHRRIQSRQRMMPPDPGRCAGSKIGGLRIIINPDWQHMLVPRRFQKRRVVRQAQIPPEPHYRERCHQRAFLMSGFNAASVPSIAMPAVGGLETFKNLKHPDDGVLRRKKLVRTNIALEWL